MPGLQRQQHRSAPLAADADSLDHAQEGEQNRRCRADLFVRGQQADEHGAQAHQEQGDHQRGLAAHAVAEVAEEHSAQRPGGEAGGEGEERQHLAEERGLFGEEELGENQRRRRAVEEEIVPLDGRAHGAGDHCLHQRPFADYRVRFGLVRHTHRLLRNRVHWRR